MLSWSALFIQLGWKNNWEAQFRFGVFSILLMASIVSFIIEYIISILLWELCVQIFMYYWLHVIRTQIIAMDSPKISLLICVLNTSMYCITVCFIIQLLRFIISILIDHQGRTQSVLENSNRANLYFSWCQELCFFFSPPPIYF